MANEVRKYRIKQEWIFNLESMHDKLWCIEYDVDEGKLDFPFEVAGTTIKDYEDLSNLREECGELAYRAWDKVTGKEYGRIKQIVEWRVMQRYVRCLKSGMSEKEAGKCFEGV